MRWPDRGIHFVDEKGDCELVTYSQLLSEARSALAALRRSGIKSGSSAILQFARPREHLPVFWGLLLGEMRPLTVAIPPVYEPDQAVVQKLADAWLQLGQPPILCAATTAEPLRQLREHGILPGAEIFEIAGDKADVEIEIDCSSVEPIAFYQLSSGSTGKSKVIPITHHGIIHQAIASTPARRDGLDDMSLNWLPLDHVVPILTYHLSDVILGRSGIQLDTAAVLENPLIWLNTIERHRVTDTWSPNFGFRLLLDALESAPMRRWDLSSIRRWMNAGELVTPETMRDFAVQTANFGLHARALQPAFGMAETCTCVTYEQQFDPVKSVRWVRRSSLVETEADLSDLAAPDRTGFVSVGGPIAGVLLRIAHADDHTASEGQIGRLQFRGPVVTPGYFEDSAANVAAFRPDGWFDSGDLGFVADGRLYITGREKEILIINGVHYGCQEIEEVAAGIEGVANRKVAAVAFRAEGADTEALALLFVPQPTADVWAVRRAIVSALSRRIGVVPARLIPLSDEQFPRTTSGKIRRLSLRRAIEHGLFEQPAPSALADAAPVHDIVWSRCDRPDFVRDPPRHAVLFADQSGVAEAVLGCLRAAGSRCTLVRNGDGFEQLTSDHYLFRPSSRHDHSRLWSALDGRPDMIVHLSALDPPSEPATAQALRQIQDVGLFSLLAIVQSLPAETAAEIVTLTRGLRATPFDQQVAWPHATMLGLARTVPLERPGLTVRVIDMSLPRANGDLASIMAELAAPSTEPEICLRGSVRLAPRLEVRSTTTPADFGGCWIVAGGTGAVGTRVCNHLKTRHHAVVHALSRRPQQSGSGLQADVNDFEAVRSAFNTLEEEAGHKVTGILHSAGGLELASIEEMTPDFLWQAIETRLVGGKNLARLLEERRDARLVVFSTVTGLLGGALAGAYAAANSGLDAMVEHLRLRGVRAQTIRWSAWSGLGLSRLSTMEARRANGLLDLSSDTALAVMDQLDGADAYVGMNTQHPRLRAISLPADPNLPFHDEHPPATPARSGEPPAGVLENAIAEVWRNVLKCGDGLNREATFFELGGSSVQLAAVQLKLEQALGRPVPLHSLFSHPSISQLADHLGNAEADTPAVTPIIARRRRRYRVSIENASQDRRPQ